VFIDQGGLASTSALLAVKSIAESNNQALSDLMPQVDSNSQALVDLESQVAGKQEQLTAGAGMVFHEKLLEGTKVKSLTPGSNVTLDSTDDFVTISAQTPPQVVAPFSVMGPNMMAVRARFADSKAEIFAELEVNDDVRVTGIMRAAQLRSDGIVQIGSSPPAGADLAVGGSVSATGNISTSAALRANSITPVSGTNVTATDDFTVGGSLTLNGNLVGWSPFWVAGTVDASGNVLLSKGRVAFTCTREATGNYRVTFASPHPNGAIYVASLLSASPCPNFWVDQVAVSSFLAVLRTSSFTQQNATFYFTVLA
jgi:hypothetical protein